MPKSKKPAPRVFEPGDVVRLVTWGPNMAVEHMLTDGNAMCVWFDPRDGEWIFHREVFGVAVLKKIDSDAPSSRSTPSTEEVPDAAS